MHGERHDRRFQSLVYCHHNLFANQFYVTLHILYKAMNFPVLFLCPQIQWAGAYCFCPVCLSVCCQLNLHYKFWTVRDTDFIFGMHTPQTALFQMHQGQWPCDLDFDLEAVFNFNLQYKFWTVRDTDFIFGMHTPRMALFQMTPRSMTLWPWIWPWS